MNWQTLAENLGLETDEYMELIELFMETGMADYTQLKSAFDTGDADQVARRAHTISGAAGNLGLMEVHALAKSIEQAAIDNQLATVAAAVGTLKARFDDIGRQAAV